MLAFVMHHPGCVSGSAERRCYSDELRHHVLELRERHQDLDLALFADAVGTPLGTIQDWLRAAPQPSALEDASYTPATPPPTDAPSPATDAISAKIQTVVNAWHRWHGNFTAFCDHIRHHERLDLGNSLIASILFFTGERRPNRRPGRSRDEHALRKAFQIFFPGAQWVGDGTEVSLTIDGQPFTYNLELLVDAFSDAWVGLSVRDTEDSQAVVQAFTNGVDTTGQPPIATLLDNRPSNHTPEVDAVLGDTLRLRATPNRPQNKAHAEGAFGLFAQHTPPIDLQTADPRQLGAQALRVFAEAFARLLNHRPRRDRNGKSRAEIYTNHQISDQDRAKAHEALRERLRLQEQARLTREARIDPIVRAILDSAFERLRLLDPERYIRNTIACYPRDDIVDAIATFEAKLQLGTLPPHADARYLLGIVRNLHHIHEAESITHALLTERLAARDMLLQPLVAQRDDILHGNPADALPAFVDHALHAKRSLDRGFWIGAAAQLIADHPEPTRLDLFRSASRRIHTTFAASPSLRSALERNLARQIWPLS
jgi:hypothetical protein